MARSKKTKKADEIIEDVIEDAVETESDVDEAVENTDVIIDEDTSDSDSISDEDTIEDAVEPETTPVKKAGFMSTALGGVVAAAVGFGTAQYLVPEGWPFPALERQNPTITEQSERIAALEAQLNAINTQDLIATAQAETAESLGSEIAAVDAKIADLSAKIDTIQINPSEEGSLPNASALNGEIEALKAQVADMVSSAKAKEEVEVAAQRLASTQVAVSGVTAAIDSGSNFAEHLENLTAEGVDVPVELINASEGVASMNTLQDIFPDAARAGLAISRDGAGASVGGIGDFFKSQLNARSVQPKEGSDVDAVLSRSEAAVRENRLNDALAEIETLPDEVKSAMNDWLSAASQRQTALSALDALKSKLNSQ